MRLSVAAFAALLMIQSSAAASEPPVLSRPPVATRAALPAAVGSAVSAPFAAAGLGNQVAVTIMDAATGGSLYRKGAQVPVLPASTLKLVTAVTALTVLPAEATLRTTLLMSGAVAGGVLKGDLVLVGGGDPTLSSLDTPEYPAPTRLSALVAAVRRNGITAITGGIIVDTSAYTGPALGAGWMPSYVGEGAAAPVTALMVDGARSNPASKTGARSAKPEILAGQRFSAMLKARGVKVGTGITRGSAPAGATEIGSVRSAPLPALVERMLQHSDNDLAEALLRMAAVAKGLPASFSGGAQVVTATLTALGLPMNGVVLHDGSGLSRADRVTTDLLAAVLRLATSPDRPELRPILTGLPVAGFNGTLVRRYRDTATRAAAGLVRAKTGTLDNVTTLAGVMVTRSGQLLVFATSADRVPTAAVGRAARLLDVAVAAAQACGCP